MILVKPSHEILTQIDNRQILQSIERAGRTCYKSELGNDPETFAKRIIARGHESVLEHESISVKFICDRGISHELVRHRIASFSQESTRYCSYKNSVTFVLPPWVNVPEGKYCYILSQAENADQIWMSLLLEAENAYYSLTVNNWSPQQARSVLPNSLKTELIMTANLKEWRHILKLRTASAAHPQMQELMIPLLESFQKKIPVVFDDIIGNILPQPPV